MGEKGQILICCGIHCTEVNSKAIKEAFEYKMYNLGLYQDYLIFFNGCLGLCQQGPSIIVVKNNIKTTYSRVKLEDVGRIIEEHIINDRIVTDLLATAREQ